MSPWISRVPAWANGPWIAEDYYPWDETSQPWLVDNSADADWTPRTPV